MVFIGKKVLFAIALLVFVVLAAFILVTTFRDEKNALQVNPVVNNQNANTISSSNPLSINYLRSQDYPGSDIKIEQTLVDRASYHQYLTSYQSDGLKIYALLTVPKGQIPSGGWPVILFNHGYVTPQVYSTVSRYSSYVDYFARNGYIVFKPDYRGNGNSQGQSGSAYYSANYVVDDLNALSSIKKYPDANPDKVGIWGHSMGGNITLKDLVIRPSEVQVAVIWGGVVGSYNDLINNWQRRVSYQPDRQDLYLRNNNRQNLIDKYGTPKSNPDFWNSIDPTYFLTDIKAAVQLDVGGADEEVPNDFSKSLYDNLQALGKPSEYYVYPESDHNISQEFSLAMQRSVAFFDKYLK